MNKMSVKSAYLHLLKSPTVMIGMITALIFQVLFSLIWLTGYDHLTDNVNRFVIAVVNEDQAIGKQAVQGMMEKLPFQIKEEASLEQAMTQLDERKLQMVVHIPENFSKQLMDPTQKAVVTYSVNESNPSMMKSVMQSVASQLTTSLNEQAVRTGMINVLEKVQIPQLQANSLSESMAARVVADMDNIHPISNFSWTMVPMMLLLASFVGCMLFAMEMNKAAKTIKQTCGRWTLLTARSLLNITASLVITTVGTGMVTLMGVHSEQGFAVMWLFQLAYVITFLFVAQLSFYIFSDAGAWVNIALLSIQLITSGAMLPRELLPTFYRTISDYSPATYAVNGIMNLVNGGPAISNSINSLLFILATVILMTAAIVGGVQLLQRKSKEPAQMVS
ncbi:ABC transporter permease [Paenibacillus profundus]|uniref:ABC transporter permease n=1 Tax=Paenibacillus profundus TaxID=1173085 RepID=A0ABS8YLL5_9BACL|nr:ABC transporter permease [Paenibacillus profundus]MCE5172745.1 ABC transporter permease [Paenibacillus profundus]